MSLVGSRNLFSTFEEEVMSLVVVVIICPQIITLTCSRVEAAY